MKVELPDPERRERAAHIARYIGWIMVVIGIVGLGISVFGAGSAAAQTNNTTVNYTNLSDTAPYYPNQTAVGNQTSWFPENVSLDSIGQMVARTGPYVIGTGDQIPGGTTYAGTLATGLVMVGIFIGSAAFTGIGIGAGAVIASVAGYGLVELGLAPSWLRIILLLIIGVVAAVAALRTSQ